MNLKPDEAKDVRKGESLDLEILNDYLRRAMPSIGLLTEVKQFHGGYSNLTYQLNTQDKAYVLRRPPFGANIKTAHDMAREFHLLNKIRTVYTKVPEPVLLCEDQTVMDATFI